MQIIKKPILLVIVATSLFFSGCGDNATLPEGKADTPKLTNETQVETQPQEQVMLADGEYKIKVSAAEISTTKVDFTVSTNLPLPVEVMAGVSLQGQKDSDTWIGYNQKVMLKKTTQIFSLSFPKKPLPSGKYDAEVTFYPRWGAKKGNPNAAKIGRNIEGVSFVNLSGDGQNAEDRMERDRLQLWVMENVNPATSWDNHALTTKLGEREIVAVKRMNPNIIKGYYFPKVDMTIYVNVLKHEYVTFRKGRDTNGM